MKKNFCLIVFLVLLLTISTFVLVACNNNGNEQTNGTGETNKKTFNYSFTDGGKDYKYEATLEGSNSYLSTFYFYCNGESVNNNGRMTVFDDYRYEYKNNKIQIINTNDDSDEVEIGSITLNDDGTLSFTQIPNIMSLYFPSSLFVGNYSNNGEDLVLNNDGTGTLGDKQFIWKSYFGTTIVISSTNEAFVGKLSLYTLNLEDKTAKCCGNVYAQKDLEPIIFNKKLNASPVVLTSKATYKDILFLHNDEATYVSAIMGTDDLINEVMYYDYYFGKAVTNETNDGINLSVSGLRGENVVQLGNTLKFMWSNFDGDNNPISFDYAYTLQEEIKNEEQKNKLCIYYYGDATVTGDSWDVNGKYCDVDTEDDYFEIEIENNVYYVFNKKSLDRLMYVGKKGYVGVPNSAKTYYCDETIYIILDSVCYRYYEYDNCSNPGTYAYNYLIDKDIITMSFCDTFTDLQYDVSIIVSKTNDSCEAISVGNIENIEYSYDTNRSFAFSQTQDFKWYTSYYDSTNSSYVSKEAESDLTDRSFYINFNASDDLSTYSGKTFELIVTNKLYGSYFLDAYRCHMVSKTDSEIRFYYLDDNGQADESKQYTLKLNDNGVYQVTEYDSNAENLVWKD